MSQLAPSSARDCGPICLFFFLIEGSKGDVRWPPKREPMRCQHAILMSWEHGGWGSGPHHASYAGAARGTNRGYLKLVNARQSLLLPYSIASFETSLSSHNSSLIVTRFRSEGE